MILRCDQWCTAGDTSAVVRCGRGPVVLAYRGEWQHVWRLRCQEHARWLEALPAGVEPAVVRGEENVLAEVVSDALARIA